MADRLNTWQKKVLPNPAHEKLASDIAVAKCSPISTSVVAAYASKNQIVTSPEDREKIAVRACEHMAILHASGGRPARS